jgi:mannan endo-1,4-beta-mannosidase
MMPCNQKASVGSFLLFGIVVFSLAVSSAGFAGDGKIKFEAEDAVLTGVTAAAADSGYSGTGYVTGFDAYGDQAEFRFDAEYSLYTLTLGFSTPEKAKGFSLTINGQKTTAIFPATNGSFTEYNRGRVLLKDGQNTLIVGKGQGGFNLDFIRLDLLSLSPPDKPTLHLTDPDATPSARALFRFLVDGFGNKILAGQQDMSEIQYVVSVTGKSPAIGVFDLIEYSPSRVEHGSNPRGAVESWISWARSGNGIISLSWHWNAPADLIDQSGKEWWRGFYTDATTFDFASALADTASERYRLMLRDIDAIAAELKKLQLADMPVLWRPLHEASGGWFWWGARGPEPFKKLWRIMHDRMTRVHRLHCLIWVYTSGAGGWYPGDDVVDVASLDVYTDQSSSMSGEWEALKSEFNGKKLMALSESGTLPDPDKCRLYSTWWSWFSIWSGTFIRDADRSLLKRVYLDQDVVTLDELPDWRREFAPAVNDGCASAFNLAVYPNPSHSNPTLVFTTAQSADVRLSVFDLRGRKIREEAYGGLSPGRHTMTVDGNTLSSGLYLVRLVSANCILNRKFIQLK